MLPPEERRHLLVLPDRASDDPSLDNRALLAKPIQPGFVELQRQMQEEIERAGCSCTLKLLLDIVQLGMFELTINGTTIYQEALGWEECWDHHEQDRVGKNH